MLIHPIDAFSLLFTAGSKDSHCYTCLEENSHQVVSVVVVNYLEE